ncbi:MAG TPA: ABC transporter substrate-binding protein [Stellaceae bacterium]|nr:ABC transporter substrate-binding protein [Stellaceae bacterium]
MKCTFAAAFFGAGLLVAGAARAQGLPDTIKIGVLTDMSSLYADNTGQGSVTAAQMAIDDFGGTVLGKKIELISADHQNKPDLGASLARQWFDSQGVQMITDVPTSSVGLAVQEVARAENKLVINVGSASSDLDGKSCAPTGLHWVYNTVALANGTGAAVVKAGGDSWFFITADYAFGHALQRDTAAVVEANGGKVLGSVNVPLNNADFSSYLLQAQRSGAKIIGLANAGGDTQNTIKQAAEFGIVQGGQKLAGLLIFVADVHSLGLQTAQGLQLTESFYWDQDDQTRAWSKKYFDKMHKEPTMVHAGVYSAVTHYLESIKATGGIDASAIVKELKSKPINDFIIRNGGLQDDGMLVHDMYLYEVKKSSESKGEWDLYKLIATIPAEQAYKRPHGNECPLVKG